MKESSVTIDDWDWCIDDESRLSPWFHIFRDVEKTFAVKASDSTYIFRVEDIQKRRYIVKHFFPDTLADHVVAFFSAKAKNVYRSAQLLHEAGIPCVEYPGWAKNGTESMLFSEEIPDTVSALEYWFRTAIHDSALRREFITKLSSLVMNFVSGSVRIRNLSLEHILIRTNGSGMYILNPHDAEYLDHGFSMEERLELLDPFLELRGEIPLETMVIALQEASFTDNVQELSDILHNRITELEDPLRDGIFPEWASHIEAEESGPLCRVIRSEEDDTLILVRNTIWYQEIPLPDDTNSTAEEMSEENAREIWLDSFKAQLLRNHLSRIPLSWEKYGDGRNIIRFAANYDDVLYCGFNQ
ncbi:MAG: hypothetical protein J6S58_01640 [Lentisphaeria bacterium]|nr:hypothetical protein [Lentisphaeria bacterium]